MPVEVEMYPLAFSLLGTSNNRPSSSLQSKNYPRSQAWTPISNIPPVNFLLCLEYERNTGCLKAPCNAFPGIEYSDVLSSRFFCVAVGAKMMGMAACLSRLFQALWQSLQRVTRPSGSGRASMHFSAVIMLIFAGD